MQNLCETYRTKSPILAIEQRLRDQAQHHW